MKCGTSEKAVGRDFPGEKMVKNSPCDPGDTGSISVQETKIPQAKEQLSLEFWDCKLWSPHTTIRESMYCNERSRVP